MLLPLLWRFREPRRASLRGSAVTNCGGGGSPAGILPHKDCLFSFTWTIFTRLSLILPSLTLLYLFSFFSFLPRSFLPFSYIRWEDFLFSTTGALMTSIIKSACLRWRLMRNMRGLTNSSDEAKTCVHLKTPAVLTSLEDGGCLIVTAAANPSHLC